MVRWVTVVGLFVVLVLVGTGPLIGVDVTDASETSFGDGNATVTEVALDRDGLAVTRGRFGANVTYLRAPTATVTVDSVTDRPRLVYIVEVPSWRIKLVETRVVTEPGTYRLAPDDRAMRPRHGVVYDTTLSVRLQSFTTDRTLARTTVPVEGPP